MQAKSAPDCLLPEHQQTVDKPDSRGPGNHKEICNTGGALEVSQPKPERAHDDEQHTGGTWRQDILKDAGQSTPEQQFLHERNQNRHTEQEDEDVPQTTR